MNVNKFPQETTKAFKVDARIYRAFRLACAMKDVSLKDQIESLIKDWATETLKNNHEKLDQEWTDLKFTPEFKSEIRQEA